MRRSMAPAWMVGRLAVVLLGAAACTNTLVFGTATKFGLDISQRADRLIEINMGYDRAEFVSIPASGTDARRASAGLCPGAQPAAGQSAASAAAPPAAASTGAPATDDTYSVMATFHVSYDTPWGGDPLRIRQFFATGVAAQQAACQPNWRRYFGNKTGEIEKK
jgi:hypothetical protein